MTEQTERGTLVSVFAVLFAILAVSNLLKPLQILGDETGFVLFGTRLTGTANLIAGPLAGLYLLAYAYGIWQMKRFAVGMAHVYALYVVLNLLLFLYKGQPDAAEPPSVMASVFFAAYSIVAVGVSAGAAIILTKRKHELR